MGTKNDSDATWLVVLLVVLCIFVPGFLDAFGNAMIAFADWFLRLGQ